MALAKIKKIRLVTVKQHKDAILEILQSKGVIEVVEINDETPQVIDQKNLLHQLQKVELEYSNVEFAINLLSKQVKAPGLMAQPPVLTTKEIEEVAKKTNHKQIAEECMEIEDHIVKATNNINGRNSELSMYQAWENLNVNLENLNGSSTSGILVGSLKKNIFTEVFEEAHKISKLITTEVLHSDKNNTYFIMVYSRELEKEIKAILADKKFIEAELPKAKGNIKEYIANLKSEIEENQKILNENNKKLKELSKNLENLKIVYDYLGWEKEKLQTTRKLAETKYITIIMGWITAENIKKIEEEIDKKTKEFTIIEIEPEENEKPPVLLQNSSFMQPFEAVTSIYGLPRDDELDPTPFLSAYFIVFFALCLTDAGYGLFMFIIMWMIQKKFKLAPGIKKLIRVLMYGGIVTFFIGALFGGWFGLTTDQVPAFLTYQPAGGGEKMFISQTISAIQSPVTVLILALILGFIQILMGVTMKFAHAYKTQDKKEALLNDGVWVFMLLGIGIAIAGSTVPALSILGAIGKWWVIIAAIALILTQGRDKKNIIMKFFSGVLSLYGLVGYLSDILSYSRLLALGLATAIIGLAVNTVVGLVIGLPLIGWLLAGIVFIGGHIFNLLINALGSFIHSGRLQFVEFFTKFMEGGGKEFKPFMKRNKYLFIKQ